MAARHHRHVALTEPLDRFVEQQVAQSIYGSAIEVVRVGLRLLIEQRGAGSGRTDVDGDERG